MQLIVNDYKKPEEILFNYEELKQEITGRVEFYKTLVYTEDQLQEAKADAANLRKLKKALNDERIRREREYLEPFNEFKKKINELIAIIDEPIAVIDRQLKEAEEARKAEKEKAIREYIATKALEDITLPINPKWLNASASMKSIQAEIDEKAEKIESDLKTIEEVEEEYRFEAVLAYKHTLDLAYTLREVNKLKQIKRMKEEAAKVAAEAQEALPEAQAEAAPVQEAPKEEEKQWVRFAALLTREQALKLRNFFNAENITFKAI